MRLGLEALYVDPHNITGIERYLSLVLEALSSVRRDFIDEIMIFAQNRRVLEQWVTADVRVVETQVNSFENTVEMEEVDLLHCTFVPPRRPLSCPLLYTLYDVGRYTYPELMDRKVTDEHIARLKRLLDDGISILTVSYSSQAEICDVLGLQPDRVHVVRLFVSERLRRLRNLGTIESRRILDRLRLSPPFLLTVGCYTPTKNVSTLVRAFRRIKRVNRALKLVIVGRRGWDQQCEVLALRTPGVIRIAEVSDIELAVLYQYCDQYVSASLIEGFGLPILEATYFGAPVSCSNIGAYHEILGRSAHYFDPHSIDDIVKCLLSPTKARSVQEQGLKQFSSSSMGRQLLHAYIASSVTGEAGAA